MHFKYVGITYNICDGSHSNVSSAQFLTRDIIMPITTVRPATSEDASTIRSFILELAIYEKEPDAVKVTVEELEAQLASDRPPFEALIAELDGTPVGFALFFQSYSTWEGKAGLYLEDLYVSPEHRGNKIGTALFRQLSQIALDRDYARIDWQVLDWNEPSIKYYQSIQAEIRKDWYPCRLEGEGIVALSKA